MPELPEVETTKRGIEPYLLGQTIENVIIRTPKLRWAIHPDLPAILSGSPIQAISRRAKYLLFHTPQGILVIHLGMSGSLRIFRQDAPKPGKHDHFDLIMGNHATLRLRDPRRFGAILWHSGAMETLPQLQNLGPEPLSEQFHASYLKAALKKRRIPIKTALMTNSIVVGMGNIYANEALFAAGIDPMRPANRLTAPEHIRLVSEIQQVLQRAITAGGSTLRDFVDSEGQSGYFQQQYHVYGRENEPCHQCSTPIIKRTTSGRATYYCPHCQR